MQMETQNITLSRLLPKTNQVANYLNGDDGEHQAGWWKGKTVANNRVRFVEKTIAGDALVKDLATGLMWIKDGNHGGSGNGNSYDWADSCLWCWGMVYGGFSDWRLPNILELISIQDFAADSAPLIYSVFTNTASTGYWTSTSSGLDANKVWTILFNTEFIAPVAKSGSLKFRGVRSI